MRLASCFSSAFPSVLMTPATACARPLLWLGLPACYRREQPWEKQQVESATIMQRRKNAGPPEAKRRAWVLRQVLSIAALFGFATVASSQGVITTVAGTDWLFPGNGGPALNAPLSETFGLDLAVDASGNYYIADDGNLNVMRVGTDGIINVIAGNGFSFVSGNGGLAVNAGVLNPISVALEAAGDVYIGEFGGDVRKVTPDGIINRIAGIGIGGYAGD